MSTPTRPYENVPMDKVRAFDVAIEFGRASGLPCFPIANGEGFDALVPMEIFEGWAIRSGALQPRPIKQAEDPK